MPARQWACSRAGPSAVASARSGMAVRPARPKSTSPGGKKMAGDRAALILTGGGARVAYQVGVLRAVAEMLPPKAPSPFRIVCGTSAGAINATAVAAASDDFKSAVADLEAIWSRLVVSDIYRADFLYFAQRFGQWLLSLVPVGNRNASRALLDNSPLAALLRREIDFSALRRRIREGSLDALSITASSYRTGMSVSFCAAADDAPMWQRSQRIGVGAEIGAAHLLASSAIPIRVRAGQDRRRIFRRRRDAPAGAHRAGTASGREAHPRHRRRVVQRRRDPRPAGRRGEGPVAPAIRGADRKPRAGEHLCRRAGHRPRAGAAHQRRGPADPAGAPGVEPDAAARRGPHGDHAEPAPGNAGAGAPRRAAARVADGPASHWRHARRRRGSPFLPAVRRRRTAKRSSCSVIATRRSAGRSWRAIWRCRKESRSCECASGGPAAPLPRRVEARSATAATRPASRCDRPRARWCCSTAEPARAGSAKC